jgi:hypothetical protein
MEIGLGTVFQASNPVLTLVAGYIDIAHWRGNK